MRRREFLRRTATGAVLAGATSEAIAASWQRDNVSARGDEFRLALTQAEARAPIVLAQQITAPGQRQLGGFNAPAYGFAYAALAASELAQLGALFCHPESRYHHDRELAERQTLALGYLEREQHADGTFDLPTTNFHSPPDTAFVVADLTLFYRLLAQDKSPAATQWLPRLESLLRRAATAIATGGIHTPNHRWVAAAALAGCWQLFKKDADERWLRRIEQWLAEGIDCNADGEYTELSNAVYNRITNRALLTMAESLERPELLEPVRRNLRMMLYCAHPDGEIVTDYSRRQDRQTRAAMNGYYLQYRALSVKDNNGEFAAMADETARAAQREPTRISLAGDLGEMMLRPELRNEKVTRASLPTDYEKLFAESGVVRLRRHELSATLVTGSSRFLALRHRQTVLEAVRVASAFFGKGQFISRSINKEKDGWLLTQHLEADYRQPLNPGEGIPNRDWESLNHQRRARSHICQLDSRVSVREIERGVEITVNINGTDHVPCVIECWLRPGGKLSAESAGELIAANGSSFLLSGAARYSVGDSSLVIGPGRADHRWAQLRGAEAPLTDATPLTIAGFTPFHHVLRIQAQR